ncbi:hypothetical protein Tco_1342600 [Tanacetum coccineum]
MVERYIKGFPERIKGNITSARPTTLHDAINLARELVEQAVQATATTTINTTSRIGGKRLLENRRCQKLGHQEMDCGVRLPGTGDNHLRNVTCYGCGEKGHLRHMYPKRRNQQNESLRGG